MRPKATKKEELIVAIPERCEQMQASDPQTQGRADELYYRSEVFQKTVIE